MLITRQSKVNKKETHAMQGTLLESVLISGKLALLFVYL